MSSGGAPADLFFSYSHKDEALRDSLEEHLALLQRQGHLRTWHDRRIGAGDEWAGEIDQHLEQANIILLLVSPSFLASDYCYDLEMGRALERHQADEARVVPVILRPCDWHSAPFARLQALPKDGRPITTWEILDVALLDVAQGIRRIIEERPIGWRAPREPLQEPVFPSPETRELSETLESAYRQRAEVIASGGDPTALNETIVGIKRELRSGPQLQAGDFLLEGRFKLLEPIGRGGFATVWKAYDAQRRSLVAVKVLHPQYVKDKGRRERFFRGARYMVELRHPNIVEVIESECEDGGYYFFVMEYVAGSDFRQAVLAEKLSIDERLDIVLEVGAALEHAHQNDIIHRDVKPANILLDLEGRPKLTDFDLVRAADTTGGTRTAMMGTFLYAAPEALVDAKQASQPADVYGLGMTAVFAFFGGDLPADALWELPALVDSLDVDQRCRSVLKMAVARRIDSRWGSVEVFCGALRQSMESPSDDEQGSPTDDSPHPKEATDQEQSEGIPEDEPQSPGWSQLGYQRAALWARDGLRRIPWFNKRRRRSLDFESDLGWHRNAVASAEEIAESEKELSNHWEQGLHRLKEAHHNVYELPWFLLVGEPQSGKSATLRHSGLDFPIGQEEIPNPGGTRSCDWWFHSDAIVLDTAGRLTFQEDAAPDHHEWERLLALLKKYRSECPINGVIVVIPATSLTADTTKEQQAKARNIRWRIRELEKRFGIRFPIFVVITKTDRVLGFTELFSLLEPGEARQILGWSSSGEARRWYSRDFRASFSQLARRMLAIRLRLLQKSEDTERAERAFAFPEEFATLEEPLEVYLDGIFRSSRFEEPIDFRGLYFTSAIQEGRPVPRACQDLLRVQVGDHFRWAVEDLETIYPSRSFFVHDLYKKKVFPEQGLIHRTIKAQKRGRLEKRLVIGLTGVALVAAFLLLFSAALHMSQVLRPIQRLADDALTCLQAADSDRQCGVDVTWELVYGLERASHELSSSGLAVGTMLQGGVDNEISSDLLRTLQAGLMRSGVLGPLLESLEARSTPEIWQGEEPFDYVIYRQAFEARLRFDQYQRVAGPEQKEALREGQTLAPILQFLASRPRVDPTIEGQEIDEWLKDASQLGDIDEIEKIFQDVLHSDERLDLIKLEQPGTPKEAKATFEAYWSVPVLATNAARTEGNRDNNEGTTYPGPDIDTWQQNCQSDYEALRQIYDRLVARSEIVDHCQVKMQRDWQAWKTNS